jgi:hypothetical protein
VIITRIYEIFWFNVEQQFTGLRNDGDTAKTLLSTISVDKAVGNCFMSRKDNVYSRCFKKIPRLSQL